MNTKILIVDDIEDIHQSMMSTLSFESGETEGKAKQEFSNISKEVLKNESIKTFKSPIKYSFESAFSGKEAIKKVQDLAGTTLPIPLAIMDIRMPPGLDGAKCLKEIWSIDPRIYAIICTAHSDYSWEEFHSMFENKLTKQLLIIKKPFDPITFQQSAYFLINLWNEKNNTSIL